MSEIPDGALVDRYLAGDASADERARVQAWIDAKPGRAEAIARLKSGEHADAVAWDANAAWTRFSERRNLDSTTTPPRVLPIQWRRSANVWRIAAILLVVVGLSAVWKTRGNGPFASRATQEVFTLNGQRTTVTLDDGTRVSLNGGSRLRFDAPFGRQNRDVHLDGEAYFEVSHDAARPFRVHAGNAVAQDLGTRFTVSAYPDQSSVEVAVAEGLVALSRDSASGAQVVQLAAGSIGTLSSSGMPTVALAPSLDRYLAWTTGALVLDGVTLRRAVGELERWYDVDITISDSTLAARPVTARFHGESVQQALDAISLALGAHIERRGAVFVISPGQK